MTANSLVTDLFRQPEHAARIVEEAHEFHRKRRMELPVRNRLKKNLSNIKSQIETLVERLATLPKGVDRQNVGVKHRKRAANGILDPLQNTMRLERRISGLRSRFVTPKKKHV